MLCEELTYLLTQYWQIGRRVAMVLGLLCLSEFLAMCITFDHPFQCYVDIQLVRLTNVRRLIRLVW